jgi:hypothetical protein
MCQDQNAGQNHNTKTGNESFERAEQFGCLGTTLTNQNSIHEEITSRFKLGNTCYHSVLNLLSSSLLPANKAIMIYKIVILLLVLYRYIASSVTLREKYRLRLSENRF